MKLKDIQGCCGKHVGSGSWRYGFIPYWQKILQRLRADFTASAGGDFGSVEKRSQILFLGNVKEGLRTLQRLRADVTGFVGGGICSTEKKSQILGLEEMWKNGLCTVYDFWMFWGWWFERVRQVCNKVRWSRCGGFLVWGRDSIVWWIGRRRSTRWKIVEASLDLVQDIW